MISPMLSLALALAYPSAAQPGPAPIIMYPADAPSPSREREISLLAADWTSYRNRADRMFARYPAAAAKVWDQADLTALLGEIRAVISDRERIQEAAAGLARKAIRESEPPSSARLAREAAVTALFEGRALQIYGNKVPRVLDTVIVDAAGNNDGRRYAGPEWAIVIEADEADAYCRLQIARAGFTPKQYAVFEAAARAAVGPPPPHG